MTGPLARGLVSYDPRGELHEAELSLVRAKLDNLTRRRFMTGLTPSQEARYNELCLGERALLDLSGLEGDEPPKPARSSSHYRPTRRHHR